MKYFARRRAKKRQAELERQYASGGVLQYRGLTVPVSQAQMPFPVYQQILAEDYEVPEITAVEKLIKAQDRVLELGTGLGIVSGLASRMVEGLEIRSFEANPALLPQIHELHRLNDISCIRVENAMLEPSPNIDIRPFHIHRYFPQGSVIESEDSERTIEIRVLDLNQTIQAFRPSIMICDIEGAEEIVFAGANLDGLRALVIELHPDVVSRSGVKKIYDTCSSHGLYPRVEYSSELVVAFEKI